MAKVKDEEARMLGELTKGLKADPRRGGMNYVEVRMTRLLLFALQDIQAALPFKGDDIDLRNWFSERNAQALLNAINECGERRYGFAYPPGTYIVRGGHLIDTLTEALFIEEKRLREEEKRAEAEKWSKEET